MKIDTHPYRKLEKKIIKYISSFMASIIVSSDKESFMKRFEIHTSKRLNGYTKLSINNGMDMDVIFIHTLIKFIDNNFMNKEITYIVKQLPTSRKEMSSYSLELYLQSDYTYDPKDLETYLRMKGIKL
ncbi:MAG: hypothetical protein IKO49_01605 [Bacilli bacterium]|nr:hypothetical protein [Clostridia bacterium]MBR4617996.1 hypothetical protein [Bacilli bacterium]